MNVLRSRTCLRSVLVSIFDSQCVVKNKRSPLLSINRPISYSTLRYTINTMKKLSTVKEKEREELVYADDPDTFGTISKADLSLEKYEDDEGDKKEEEFIKNDTLDYQKLPIREYAVMIKEHLNKNKLKEALDILEVKMLKEDRVKPDKYIYNLLISGCGRLGYTKKAFSLFNDMKKRGLRVTGGIYTSLLNACANSPWKEDGLSRAIRLRSLMEEKSFPPNVMIYNSLIKAFGRCGDIEKAFAVVDEMQSRKFKIRVHNFNFLLQACVSDKKYGFRHALIVWHKMLSLNEKPNIFTFNLMLRCIKECDVGDNFNLTAMSEINPKLLISDNSNVEETSEAKEDYSVVPLRSEMNTSLTIDRMPNLLSKTPHMGSVVCLNQIKTAKDRFMLIGGFDNFMKELKFYTNADIKSFTILLELIPDTIEDEEKLLSVLNSSKVKPDIDFYNFLMRKRCLRNDYEAAKDVLKLVEMRNKTVCKYRSDRKKMIKLNVMTYGILAMTCDRFEKGKNFLDEMKTKKMRVNSEILGTLLHCGIFNGDFEYVLYIMNYSKEDRSTLNKYFIKHLEKFKYKCLKRIEKIKNQSSLTDEDKIFINNYDRFFESYKALKNDFKMSNDEEFEHPWTQFRVNQPVSLQRPTEKKVKKRYHKKPGKPFFKYQVKI